MDGSYPIRPVRLIVPFTPAALNDFIGRTLATKLTEFWGQQVGVDNRAGGNTVTGTDIAAKSPADGYTLVGLSIIHAMMAGIKLLHVPYKGGSPMLTDVIGGHLQFTFLSHATTSPHVKAGRVREKFNVQGLDIIGSTPEEAHAHLREEVARWARVVEAANIRPD